MSNSIFKTRRCNIFSRCSCLILFLAIAFCSNAQTKGYTWIFSAHDTLDEWGNHAFSAIPATTATTDTKPLLSLLNPGSAGTLTENQSATITGCSSPSPVVNYTDHIGFEYLNSGQFISNTYTIEMVINISTGGKRRLMSFYSLSDTLHENGVYLNSSGEIDFYTGTSNTITTSLSTSTWYHLTFVRESDGDILFYLNGVLQDTYNDNSGHFIPHPGAPHYGIITFLKDDNGDESSGTLSKISIYDAALPAVDIEAHFGAICEGANPPNGAPGYIPKFTGPTTFANSAIYESQGSIGIGTTDLDTSYKLFVEKGIRTRLVQVDIDVWPDFVFDKKYKLPSLKDIEQHIGEHKHLPGIPAASEVEAKGLDVGKNQAALLQKIEELTLYIIEQNKKAEEMNTMILELKKEMQAVKKKVK